MKQEMRECCQNMVSAICRPEVRHSIQYDCGIYKSPASDKPIAAMQIGHNTSFPLWRLVAVVGALTATALALHSLKTCMHSCHCDKTCKH